MNNDLIRKDALSYIGFLATRERQDYFRFKAIKLNLDNYFLKRIQNESISALKKIYKTVGDNLNADTEESKFWEEKCKQFKPIYEQGNNGLDSYSKRIKAKQRRNEIIIQSGIQDKPINGRRLGNNAEQNPEETGDFRTASKYGRGFYNIFKEWESEIKRNYLISGDYFDPFISDLISQRMASEKVGAFRSRYSGFTKQAVAESDIKSIRNYTGSVNIPSREVQQILVDGAILSLKEILRNGSSVDVENVRFKPLSFTEALQYLTKNTSAGAPTFLKKKSEDAIRAVKQKWKEFYYNPELKKILSKYPNAYDSGSYDFLLSEFCSDFQVIFHRTQVSIKEGIYAGQKLRQVWCVPFFIVCLECIFFKPLLDFALNNADVAESPIFCSGINAGKLSNVIRNMRTISKEAEFGGKNKFYQSDYSKFDSTVPVFFYDVFFDACEQLIEMSPRMKIIFSLLRQYMKRSPFVYKGNMFYKTRGLSSGSYVTNFFGTWVNLTLCITAKRIYENRSRSLFSFYYDKWDELKDFDYVLTQYNVYNSLNEKYVDATGIAVCGDDMLWVSNRVQNAILIHLCNSMGMNIKFSEPYVATSKEIYFLGRFWDHLNRPFQPPEWYVAHSLVRSKFFNLKECQFKDEEEMELFRVLSIHAPYSNGFDELNKLYRNDYQYWPRLEKLLSDKDSTFKLIRDWGHRDRTIGYLDVPVMALFDWRLLPVA